MSGKKRPKNRDRHRASTRPPGGGRPQGVPAVGIEELPQRDLLIGIDAALRDPHPLMLLTLASSIMTTFDARWQLHGGAPAPGPSTLAGLCESFMQAGSRQTDALLKIIAEMARDDLMRERIRRSVAERKHAIPGWVLRLSQVRPYRAVEMRHVLRDGDNVVVGVHLPGNRELSMVIYIDHNLGTVVKDAFVLDRPIDEVLAAWREANALSETELSDTEINELSLADARARITPAIDQGAITFPPFESDTWPASRPLVEWIVSMLPDGGSGYERPEWSENQLAELTNAFFASDFGRPLDDDDHRSLLKAVLWFGTDYGPGDPLRWSPVAVEILLDDWIPRKLVAPADYLEKAPELLRAFVRFSHAERGIRRELTEDTLAAVDLWEPDYQEAIRTPRRQGAMALLERMGALDDVEPEWYDGLSPEGYMLATLARSVGGMDALDRLGTEPLANEPFDWSDIPGDIHERVGEGCELVDECCDALFDDEFRTASRRFLARVAVADPDIFRRRSSARTAAAAVCWVIGKANDGFSFSHAPGVRVKELMAHFGLTGSSSQRAEPMLRAIGADWRYGRTDLGDPSLLVSARRARVAQLRDLYRAPAG